MYVTFLKEFSSMHSDYSQQHIHSAYIYIE